MSHQRATPPPVPHLRRLPLVTSALSALGDRERRCKDARAARPARAAVALGGESRCENSEREDGFCPLRYSRPGERRTRQLFPRDLPARPPPSVQVLAGAGLRTGRLQGTQGGGSKPLRAQLIINLGCSERVTHSTPLALGIVPEVGPRPRAADGKCALRRLPDGSESAPGAKVGSSSPPNKFLVK